MIWWRLAWKELFNNRRFLFLFIFNMSLGLIGFILLGSASYSFQAYIDKNLKNFVTGDLVITSDIPVDQKTLNLIDAEIQQPFQSSRQISFVSMIQLEEGARLVQVFGIDKQFPLYGDLQLQQGVQATPAEKANNLIDNQNLWLHKETRLSLGLDLGDKVKIGATEFTVQKDIAKDPGGILSRNGFAPRVYVGINQIEKTGLVATGSRIRNILTIALEKETDLEKLSEQIQQKITENWKSPFPTPRVRSLIDSNDRINRLLGYMSGFLGLISIVALFLAGVGAGYLFRSFLVNRTKEIAILNSLGASREESYRILFFQILILGTLSTFTALAVSAASIELLPGLAQNLLPEDFSAVLDLNSSLIAWVMGTLGSLVFCLPVILSFSQMSPVQLFQNENSTSLVKKNGNLLRVISYLPGLLFFWILSIHFTGLERGSLFLAIFSGTLILLAIGAAILLRLTAKIRFETVLGKLAFRNLTRHKFSFISSFLAIGMGALLMNLIPQIHNGIKNEISQPEGLTLPRYFLIDIQPEQVESLKNFFKDQRVQVQELAPMVRARLSKIERMEDVKLDEKQEKRLERLFRRGFSITYRDHLTNAEKLVNGNLFSATYNQDNETPAEISIEERFSERYQLTIGDQLEFNVSGIPIKAVIKNIRSVRWNSFQPSFFVVMQPGVLEDAPQTYLASLSVPAKSGQSRFQKDLLLEFPNVTVIDVKNAIQEILSIAEKVGVALQSVAWLSIFVGLIVVYSIARSEVEERKWELNLLKVLGGNFQDIQLILIIEFSYLGFLASLLGVVFSLGVAYLISLLFFNGLWIVTWSWIFASVFTITVIVILTAFLATGKTIRQKPWKILKAV